MKTLQFLNMGAWILMILLMSVTELAAGGKRISLSAGTGNRFFPASERSVFNGIEDGTIACWLSDSDDGLLVAQKLDRNGNVIWNDGGVKADHEIGSGFESGTDYPLIFSDDQGGAVIIYRKIYYDREDVYMIRLDGNGDNLMTPVKISGLYGGYNYSPSAAKISNNELIVVWENFSDGEFNIHAQKIDIHGNKLWNRGEEIIICNAYRDQRKPVVTCNDEGKFFVSWLDARNRSEYAFDLYANTFDTDGNRIAHPENGVMIFHNRIQNMTDKGVFYNHNSIYSGDYFKVAIENVNDNLFANVILLSTDIMISRVTERNFENGSLQTNPLIIKTGKTGHAMIWNSGNKGRNTIYGISSDFNSADAGKGFDIFNNDINKLKDRTLTGTQIQNALCVSTGRLFFPWIDQGSEKLNLTSVRLSDGSGNFENTVTIEDKIIAGEHATITCHGNTIRIIYSHSGGIFAHVREIQNTGSRRTTVDAALNNFPNPFNPTTKIFFNIPADGSVSLSVFDITGRTVKTLINDEYKKAGVYDATFDGSDMPSGVFFTRLSLPDGSVLTKKMMMIK